MPTFCPRSYSHLSMGIAAFITEISTPEQRTFRLAMIHFVSGLGSPIGTKVNLPFQSNLLDKILNVASDVVIACLQIGALLWDAGGKDLRYMYIFGAGLGGKLVTLIFLVARLEMFKVTLVISLQKH